MKREQEKPELGGERRVLRCEEPERDEPGVVRGVV